MNISHLMDLSQSVDDALEDLFELTIVSVVAQIHLESHLIFCHAECNMVVPDAYSDQVSDILTFPESCLLENSMFICEIQ